MLYRKNIPGWERVARVGAGLAMMACGLGAPILAGGLVGHAVAISGVVTLLSGFIGFCPMCAMAGRRLNAKK